VTAYSLVMKRAWLAVLALTAAVALLAAPASAGTFHAKLTLDGWQYAGARPPVGVVAGPGFSDLGFVVVPFELYG
jgi:hypothetical protein